MGVMDQWETAREVLPQKTIASQVQDAVIAYLIAHPPARSFSAAEMVVKAVKEEWGCADR